MGGRCAVLCLTMMALVAHAGPNAHKTAAQRAEAQDIEDAILQGEGSLNVQLNRVHYLGQEGIVSLDLSDLVRKAHDLTRSATSPPPCPSSRTPTASRGCSTSRRAKTAPRAWPPRAAWGG